MVVAASRLNRLPGRTLRAYRLVNSKFPPIAIFDDVADADDFEDLFALQTLTNPRLLNEIGRLELIPRQDIPFGIIGCSYATAPFTYAIAKRRSRSQWPELIRERLRPDGPTTRLVDIEHEQTKP